MITIRSVFQALSFVSAVLALVSLTYGFFSESFGAFVQGITLGILELYRAFRDFAFGWVQISPSLRDTLVLYILVGTSLDQSEFIEEANPPITKTVSIFLLKVLLWPLLFAILFPFIYPGVMLRATRIVAFDPDADPLALAGTWVTNIIKVVFATLLFLGLGYAESRLA